MTEGDRGECKHAVAVTGGGKVKQRECAMPWRRTTEVQTWCVCEKRVYQKLCDLHKGAEKEKVPQAAVKHT
jgi:hypothetical protein